MQNMMARMRGQHQWHACIPVRPTKMFPGAMRQLTPGLISSLRGTAGLPPYLFFDKLP